MTAKRASLDELAEADKACKCGAVQLKPDETTLNQVQPPSVPISDEAASAALIATLDKDHARKGKVRFNKKADKKRA